MYLHTQSYFQLQSMLEKGGIEQEDLVKINKIN